MCSSIKCLIIILFTFNSSDSLFEHQHHSSLPRKIYFSKGCTMDSLNYSRLRRDKLDPVLLGNFIVVDFWGFLMKHILTHFRNYSETAYKPVDTEMSYMATSKFIKVTQSTIVRIIYIVAYLYWSSWRR